MDRTVCGVVPSLPCQLCAGHEWLSLLRYSEGNDLILKRGPEPPSDGVRRVESVGSTRDANGRWNDGGDVVHTQYTT